MADVKDWMCIMVSKTSETRDMDVWVKNVLTQVSNDAVEAIVPETIGALMGLPQGTISGVLRVSKSLLKGTAQTIVLNVYGDMFQRNISELEKSKVEQTFKKAQNVFWEFVEKDGANNAGYLFDISSPEYEGARQSAEGFLMQSMREFERKKLDVIGCYFGRNMYYGKTQWEQIFQTQKMIERLTYRQVVLIRLISEHFPGINQEYSITSSDACVEVKELFNYGIWKTTAAYFGEDKSQPILIKELVPTKYADNLKNDLMLDKISAKDVEHIIETLKIGKAPSVGESFSSKDLREIQDSLTLE